ncbi:hypothetical protein V8C44DRAFT_325520 [Trichoderma aethiopicum]
MLKQNLSCWMEPCSVPFPSLSLSFLFLLLLSAVWSLARSSGRSPVLRRRPKTSAAVCPDITAETLDRDDGNNRNNMNISSQQRQRRQSPTFSSTVANQHNRSGHRLMCACTIEASNSDNRRVPGFKGSALVWCGLVARCRRSLLGLVPPAPEIPPAVHHARRRLTVPLRLWIPTRNLTCSSRFVELTLVDAVRWPAAMDQLELGESPCSHPVHMQMDQ